MNDISDDGFGSYEIDEAGNWTYTLDNENLVIQQLGEGDTLEDTFTVLSADGTEQVISVTITGKDDEATIDGDIEGEVTEDAESDTISGTVTIDDIDAGENEFEEQVNFAAAYGSFSITVDGDWTYTLDNGNPLVNGLADGQTLTDEVEVVSVGGTVKIVTITIHGANEVITGDDGDNALIGTPEEDTITGGGGDDTISGLGSNDILIGGAGEDTISGGDGDDSVFGGTEDDTLSGNAGKDTLRGEAGDDLLNGGAGDDTLVGGLGFDTLIGGAGSDIASYIDITSARIKVFLDGLGVNEGEVLNDTFVSIEGVTGTNLSDVLSGDAGANRLIGGGGNDTIRGKAGDDFLLGGTGADNIGGGAGADTFAYTNTSHGGDTIIDFNAADDSFSFTGAVFGGLALGVLDASRFVANLTGAAGDADDRFTYETDTGILRYDADGNGGGAAIVIATLTGAPAVTAADIIIV